MTRQPASTRPDTTAKTMAKAFARFFARPGRRNGNAAAETPDTKRLIRVPAMDVRFRRICAVFAGGRCLIAPGYEADARLRSALLALRQSGAIPVAVAEETATLEEIAECWRAAGAASSPAAGEAAARADQAPVRGRSRGAGERCGVRDRRRRLPCLRHRQRPQAALGPTADGRGRPRGRRFPVPLQGRGLVPDQLPAGLLPGLLDPRRWPGAAAGGRLGAALSARPPRARRRSPVRPHVLCRPARCRHDPGAPRFLGNRSSPVRRDPHGAARRGVHRRHRGRRQVDHTRRQSRPADGGVRRPAQPRDHRGSGRIPHSGRRADRRADIGPGRGAGRAFQGSLDAFLPDPPGQRHGLRDP